MEIQNRTNNALERYNRTLNDKFSLPYPSLWKFLTSLEEEARYQVKILEDIRNGKVVAPKLKESTTFEPSLCYKKFKPQVQTEKKQYRKDKLQ